MVMVVQVSVGFIGLLPEGIMFAHHQFVARNVVRVGAVLLRLVLTVGLLSMDASLVVLAAIQLVCLLFDFTVSMLLIRRRYPAVRITLADFDWAMVRRIFSFSMRALLLSAGARLSFETDALVIGAVLGVGAIGFYAVANSLVVYLMEFTIAIAAVVAPMTTKLSTEGRVPELREMFLKWSKVSLSISLMAGLFLVVLGPRFIAWWIDPVVRASGRRRPADSDDFQPRVPAGSRRGPADPDGTRQAENGDDRVRPRRAGEPRAEPRARAAARTGRRRAWHRDSKRRVRRRRARRRLPRAGDPDRRLPALRRPSRDARRDSAAGAAPVDQAANRRRDTSAGFIAAGGAMVVLFGLVWVFFVYRARSLRRARASTGSSPRVEPGVNRAHRRGAVDAVLS